MLKLFTCSTYFTWLNRHTIISTLSISWRKISFSPKEWRICHTLHAKKKTFLITPCAEEWPITNLSVSLQCHHPKTSLISSKCWGESEERLLFPINLPESKDPVLLSQAAPSGGFRDVPAQVGQGLGQPAPVEGVLWDDFKAPSHPNHTGIVGIQSFGLWGL